MTDDVVAALLAREQISDLLHRYCQLVDDADVAGLVDLFTDDGTFDYGFGRVHRGRAALAELFGRIRANEATSHHLSNVRVRMVDTTSAHAWSVVYAYHRRADGTDYHLFGRYTDVVVTDGGGWRLQRRSLRAAAEIGTTPAPGFASHYERFPRRAGI